MSNLSQGHIYLTDSLNLYILLVPISPLRVTGIEDFSAGKNPHVDLCVCVCVCVCVWSKKQTFNKKGLVEDPEKAFKAQPRQSIKSNTVSWG